MDKPKPFNLQLFLNTRRYLALAIAFGLGAAVLLFSATYPQVKGVVANNKELKQETEKLLLTKKKAAELSQLRSSPEFAQADKVNEVLPSHKPILELLSSVHRVAKEAQVGINNLEVSPGEIASEAAQVKKEAAGKNYISLDLVLNVTGKRENVEQFMILIEQASPITTITKLSINTSTKKTELGERETTSAALELSAYFFTKTIKATIEDPLPVIGQQERDVFQTIGEFESSGMEEQTKIIGGGKEDLFGVDKVDINEASSSLQEQFEL